MVKIEFKNMSPDPTIPCEGKLEEWKENRIVYRVTVDLDEDVPDDKLQVQVVTNQDICDDGLYGYKWKKFDMKLQEQDFIQGFLNKYTYELETCYLSTSWLSFSYTFRARIITGNETTTDRKKDWTYATTPAENGLVRINHDGANIDYIKRASAMLYHSANFLGVSSGSSYTLPGVQMDFMYEHLKAGPPELPTPFHLLEKEIQTVIEPGMVLQQARNNHSFYPVQNSYESLAGEVLAMGYNSVAALWHSSPSSTELEVNMMDWLVQIMHLPESFLHFKGRDSKGHRKVMPGGGVIQPSSSVCIMVAILSARSKALGYREIKREIPHDLEKFYDTMAERAYPKLPLLCAYISDQCHNCFEKNFLLASVRIRKLPTYKKDAWRLNPDTLRAAIEADEKKGLIPFFAVATVGTTGGAIFDSVEDIGKLCKEKDIWFHVDGAYAGNMFVCEEFKHLHKGLERADSMNVTLHKWMPLCLDAAALWFSDKSYMIEPYKIHASYLHEMASAGAVMNEEGHYLMPDLSDLCIELTRKDRALKIWFVIRLLGVEGLRMHIREHIKLANYFARMVEADSEFELVNKIPEDQVGPNTTHLVQTGLCAFRLKNGGNGMTANERNKKLVETLVDEREFFLIPATLYDNGEEVWFVRMVVCANNTMISDIKDCWKKIQAIAAKLNSLPTQVLQTKAT